MISLYTLPLWTNASQSLHTRQHASLTPSPLHSFLHSCPLFFLSFLPFLLLPFTSFSSFHSSSISLPPLLSSLSYFFFPYLLPSLIFLLTFSSSLPFLHTLLSPSLIYLPLSLSPLRPSLLSTPEFADDCEWKESVAREKERLGHVFAPRPRFLISATGDTLLINL